MTMEKADSNFGNGKFTEAEHEAIDNALRRRLGPNYLSTRPAMGGQRHSGLFCPFPAHFQPNMDILRIDVPISSANSLLSSISSQVSC